MTSIIRTNAKDLWRRDGEHYDLAGYDIPEEDPVSVRTEDVTDFRRCEDGVENVSELVYRVEWANGIWAEYFTLPDRFRAVMLLGQERLVASSRDNLAAVDAALRRTAA